ncbi:Uncharacterised protein [Edwardsiella tarda]|nr:Uncharacterised protein [Edwardsiella tarda]
MNIRHCAPFTLQRGAIDGGHGCWGGGRRRCAIGEGGVFRAGETFDQCLPRVHVTLFGRIDLMYGIAVLIETLQAEAFTVRALFAQGEDTMPMLQEQA